MDVMTKKYRILYTLIIIAVFSISCRFVSELIGSEPGSDAQPTPVSEIANTPVQPSMPPTAEVQPTSDPEVTEAAQVSAMPKPPTPAPEVPLAGGYPPQTNAATIQPPEQHAQSSPC